jgi:ribosome maturation factor RimP
MTSVHQREKSLQAEISEQVRGRLPDVDVLAVEISGRERFTVYVDHPGGVDHALCERVTNVLRGYLDWYSVEVSSPGIERPLRTRDHFTKALGRKVAVRTGSDIDGRKRFRGEVVSAGERAVKVQTTDHAVDVPYDDIVRGNLIHEEQG